MRSSKVVTVVHSNSNVRTALRSALETHGCTVATDQSCAALLSDSSIRPDLILLDRSLLGREGFGVLSRLNRRWEEAEVVFLPEGLASETGETTGAPEILPIVDRLLQMRSTRELLAT